MILQKSQRKAKEKSKENAHVAVMAAKIVRNWAELAFIRKQKFQTAENI